MTALEIYGILTSQGYDMPEELWDDYNHLLEEEMKKED